VISSPVRPNLDFDLKADMSAQYPLTLHERSEAVGPVSVCAVSMEVAIPRLVEGFLF
jgi:hypothetical protein